MNTFQTLEARFSKCTTVEHYIISLIFISLGFYFLIDCQLSHAANDGNYYAWGSSTNSSRWLFFSLLPRMWSTVEKGTLMHLCNLIKTSAQSNFLKAFDLWEWRDIWEGPFKNVEKSGRVRGKRGKGVKYQSTLGWCLVLKWMFLALV